MLVEVEISLYESYDYTQLKQIEFTDIIVLNESHIHES